jgi:hypothetical protein
VSDAVPADEIESIVGIERHPTEHYARAISAEGRVYVLHSQACKDSTPDLRDCPYSVALDRGIESFIPWSGWRRAQDRAVRVEVFQGWLIPERAALTSTEEGSS